MTRFLWGRGGRSCALALATVFGWSCGGSLNEPGAGSSSARDAMPKPTSARGLSEHYVEVSFPGAVGSVASDPARYRIADSEGAELTISDAWLSEDATQVTLTTAKQTADREYRLTVREPSQTPTPDEAEVSGGTTGAGDGVTFLGSGSLEPIVMSAIALSNTSALLTFSQRMDQPSVQNPLFYRIADPDLTINSVQFQNGFNESLAILNTSSQQNILYTVKVTNVRTVLFLGGFLINPERNTATFHGIAPNDVTAPQVVGAVATSSNTILVSFSEPLADDAADPTKYAIAPPLVVIAAELSQFKNQVLLTTFPMTDGLLYTVTVSGVRDRKTPLGNLIDPAANSASFTFDAAAVPGGPGSNANEPPRVVGAISTGNTGVVVAFNKPMGDSAENHANYHIMQENESAESARLIVTDAQFLGTDRKTVQLSTLSQSEVIYRVFVVNVQDLQGNQLAPQEILVDPTSFSFRGTPPTCPRCNNGSGGIDGSGLCETDDDCDDDAPCTAGEGDCENTCDFECELIDTDGDGLPDHVEQRGWVVTVELTARDGLFDRKLSITRSVTSNPLVADTDGDGLDDATERQLATDPRQVDTDGDLLSDEREFNFFFSSPTDQDSDDEEIDDFLEVAFYKTSPILADTDGDGLPDDVELLDLNRDARQADLPKFEIDIDAIRLQIDERFTFTNASGQTVTEISSTSTSLAKSQETSQARSDVETWRIGGEFGFKGGVEQGKPTVIGELKVTGGYENVTQIDSGSVQAAQEAYESSLTKGKQFTTTREVTREVFGASVEVPLSIRLTGDIAFSITNLEVSVLQMGRNRTELLPIATLIPNSTLATGEIATFNLGPLVPEKGPIILASRDVFPNLVENLLREPRGPLVVPSNFDIVDEFGRNFAFQSQEIADRTAALVIDFGDGTVERYRVAVAGAIDDQGFVGPAGDFVGGFDERGKPVGIPLDYAFQDIIGFEKNPTTFDSILAGPDGKAETVAAGDDVQEVPPATTGLDDRRIIVSAGDDGILQTTPNPASDDLLAITRGYETSHSCNENTTERIAEPLLDGDGIANTTAAGDDVQTIPVGNAATPGATIISAGANGIIDTVQNGDDIFLGPGTVCDVAADCPGGACDGRIVLRRFKNSITGERNRFWGVFTNRNVPAGTDFGDINLQPRMILLMAFEQDIDRDGIGVREEFSYGSSDRLKDTDSDNLGDFTEIRDGWVVSVGGQDPYTAFPDPRLADSDGDGVCDDIEKMCGTDPRKRDTDDDGIEDFDELNDDTSSTAMASDCEHPDQSPNTCPAWMLGSATCKFASRCGSGSPPFPPTDLDPLNRDSDGDGLLDGIELTLGANPLDPNDAGDFLDTDEDGLTDKRETTTGWSVTVRKCNNTCAFAFNGVCNDTATCASPNAGSCPRGSDCADCGPRDCTFTAKSDPTRGDTDFDGLPDFLEFTLGFDPNSADSDGDGLLDFDEFDDFGLFIPLNFVFSGFFLSDAGSQGIGTDPMSQDTDGDRLSDNFERLDGWPVLAVVDNVARDVRSNPLFADSDIDGRNDRQEYTGADNIPPGRPGDSGDATDPTDPDTDDDTRLDGREVAVGSNPLLPDVFVTVAIDQFRDIASGESAGDWDFWIRVERPHQNVTTTILDDQILCNSNSFTACGSNACTNFATFDNFLFHPFGTRSTSFGLPLGDPFVLRIDLNEVDDCNSGVTIASCSIQFAEIFTSDSLLNGGGFQLRDVLLEEGPCRILMPFSIEVE